MSKGASWKHLERRVARALGGQRVGHLGGADVTAGRFAVECKYRAAIPAWLVAAMAQARRNAAPAQLPLLVMATHGQRLADALVVIRFSDFADCFGDPMGTANDAAESER